MHMDMVLDTVERQARGPYQASVIDGTENWSGASLRGTARQWGAKYESSRQALFRRIRKALISVGFDDVELTGVLHGQPRRRHLELVASFGGTQYALIRGTFKAIHEDDDGRLVIR